MRYKGLMVGCMCILLFLCGCQNKSTTKAIKEQSDYETNNPIDDFFTEMDRKYGDEIHSSTEGKVTAAELYLSAWKAEYIHTMDTIKAFAYYEIQDELESVKAAFIDYADKQRLLGEVQLSVAFMAEQDGIGFGNGSYLQGDAQSADAYKKETIYLYETFQDFQDIRLEYIFEKITYEPAFEKIANLIAD